jgi:hypothetical protein
MAAASGILVFGGRCSVTGVLWLSFLVQPGGCCRRAARGLAQRGVFNKTAEAMSTVLAVFADFADVYFREGVFGLENALGKTAKTAKTARNAGRS